ncbi:MarR family winged helix-turn-helix transcriptional regulator [Fulvimarina endophytica]|uniref:MarR family winged helix-turn-helix transcriptional regulator n=1 Tax=Fulvimarina endophytica TaxID=2293836 RepID=UPI001314C45B|nr:MarR family winged helix-turn-helix transcriptional regulator [Fulvimarina endophytica]
MTNQKITLALFDASRLLREAFEHAHRDMKITWAQTRILGRLYAQEGIGQVEVGAQIEMDSMTISRQVDKLVELGFVERRVGTDDRRLRRLYLTRHSRILRDDIEQRSQAVLKQALSGLDEEQQKTLLALLNTMSENLCGDGEYGAPPSSSRTRPQVLSV